MSLAIFEDFAAVGWTRGRVCHAVLRAHDGTAFRSCYYRYEVDLTTLADAPDLERACRRPGCRTELEAWKRMRPRPA